MTKRADIARVETGARNLDALLAGGLPKGSVSILGGPPGSGKTILSQQICFHNATPARPALYFNTLSEPTAKSLRHIRPFAFFDPTKVETSVRFVDLGVLVRTEGLGPAAAFVMDHIKRVKPALVVVDSFKVFDDLEVSRERLRKFGYELAVNLMAWQVTALLLGEYAPQDIATNPLFSIVDGLVTLTQRQRFGEQQRLLQIVKMRGTDHDRNEHPFALTEAGVEVFAPRITMRREDRAPDGPTQRCRTGVSKLDALLGEGIPRGSSLLIGGVAGTGKTALLLEFIYRGAQAGEKGVFFSFEETPERLLAAARGFGWSLEREVERGRVEIVFIPQPDISVERHLGAMHERVAALGARRVAVDSVSVFLHKIDDPQFGREKVFQLASLVHNGGAVGFFSTDIPYGSGRLSRFGVEETVVDGVILLTSTQEGLERQRYLEVYKLRNTAHLKGRHSMGIGQGGVTIFPRYEAEAELLAAPPAVTSKRLTSGVPGVDGLLGGGLLERSVTLVSGATGTGKSTLGLQFLAAGAARREPGLYVAFEEGAEQLLRGADELGLPLRAAVDKGLVEIMYLSRQHVRGNQLFTIFGDAIRARKARRLVLDSASRVMTEGLTARESRHLLYDLVARFRTLGVTSLLTIEARSLFFADVPSDRGLSPVADNVVLLRYVQARGQLRPTIRVIKSRTSDHDRGTYHLDLARGGLRVGAPVDGPTPGPGGRDDGAPPSPPEGPGERRARSRRKGVAG
jgi:circadian clock protein KaiC